MSFEEGVGPALNFQRLRNAEETVPAVGIDLGTTFSVVAVYQKGKVEIIANDAGSRTTPSVVAFSDGQRFVGDAAKDLPPECKIFDAKRLLGRQFKDPDIQKSLKRWPFSIVEFSGTPRVQIEVNGSMETYAPEEISAAVLGNMKDTAEAFLETEVKQAVITVPAYFNERQRQATRDAGKIAGLEVIGIINEPTAAAIAYGLLRVTGSKKVFIFDLGGGTFDVSVMSINGSKFDVIASDGDCNLGGEDFDCRLVSYFLEEIQCRHGVNLAEEKEAVHELRVACELAKRRLSASTQATVNLFFARQNLVHKGTISRSKFEDLCSDLFDKTILITKRVLKDAKMTPAAVDSVVLVGGSTRIPKVRSLLRDFFGGKDLKHSVNPDEAVAHGAAVYAALRAGDRVVQKKVLLKDVTPLSLGTDVVGDLFDVVIPKNTPIPCVKRKKYTTVYAQQERLSVQVYQGERPRLADNHYLNKEFEIHVPKRAAGRASIETIFEIDADGLLTVTAVEPTSGERRQVTVTNTEAKLGDEEIKEMVKSALRFKDQDQEEKDKIEQELRNSGVRV